MDKISTLYQDTYYYLWEHGYKVVLDIGIAGLMNQQAKTKLDKMIKSFKSDKKLELNYEIWDLKRFQQEYEDHHPSSETLEIKLMALNFKVQKLFIWILTILLCLKGGKL